VPQPLAANLVVATPGHWQGRDCLVIELADDEQKIRLTTQGGNRPSFAIVAGEFTDGVLEVEIGAELTGKGAPDDRGFVGLSFHILPDYSGHETVYLRMTNGRLNVPPPPAPRIDRAVQYVADPGFHFSESRERFPGRYEKGADVAVGRWFRYRLEVSGRRVRALVDDALALEVEDARFAGRSGPVGLFVGDGSRGFFRNFMVQIAR
jgi:3-keto-disaccharide hydrolase